MCLLTRKQELKGIIFSPDNEDWFQNLQPDSIVKAEKLVHVLILITKVNTKVLQFHLLNKIAIYFFLNQTLCHAINGIRGLMNMRKGQLISCPMC